MTSSESIPIRIVLVKPPPGVLFALRLGAAQLVSPTRSNGGDVTFNLALTLKGRQANGDPNFSGGFAQGPPTARFVYVRCGTCAGDFNSCWTRAAKVPLSGISWPMVEVAQAGESAVIVARFDGRAKDGGPACATVKLLDGGWKVSVQE